MRTPSPSNSSSSSNPIPGPTSREEALSLWPETDWDKVLALRDPAAYAEAMREICSTYRTVFLRVLWRWDEANAEDLTQDFIVDLIQNSRLRRADPALGRFRQYMGRSLINFARKQHRRRSTQKRGGGAAHLELTEGAATTDAPGAEAFDREWARALLVRVVASSKTECERPEILRMALRGLMGGDEEASGYAELAASTGRPKASLRSEVSRARARFHERLKQEVALTTVRSEIDEELRYLLRCLEAET